MIVRKETAADQESIRRITAEAFAIAPHSNSREHDLADALREAGALALSLVAEEQGEILGHIAFTEVTIDGRPMNWYGLGPVSVRPERQGKGIGRRLIETGLASRRQAGGQGCVVVGEPKYYSRFGFAADPKLRLEGIPLEFFLALAFGPEVPEGVAGYNRLFFEIA